MESFIGGVFVGALDHCFGDDPWLVVSDLEFSNGFFDAVFRAVVVGDEEGAEEDDEVSQHGRKMFIFKVWDE